MKAAAPYCTSLRPSWAVWKNTRGWLRGGVALIGCLAGLDGNGAGTVGGALRLLPENPRYFEYQGLPLVLFGHQGKVKPVPSAGTGSLEGMRSSSRFANHFYMTAFPTWVRATYEEIHAQMNDDAHWERVRAIAQAAYEHDVILHLFFWSYKFHIEKQDWSGSDMVWADPGEDGGVVLPSAGLTRRKLHELAIKRVVTATWDLPNVVYNFMWEYNVRQPGKDPQGAFHRWWADKIRQEGARIDSRAEHLISIKLGRTHPHHSGADFVVEEDGNGFWYNHPYRPVLEYRVPAVFISSDFPFADNNFKGWDHVPHSPRIWENGQVDEYRISPDDLHAMTTEGFHPAESWSSAREETLHYYLQARWYLENVGIVARRSEGSAVDVPAYRPSQRPELNNPPGFEHGRSGGQYAAVYRHPEGLAPAQAEVWVDVNGDGRFNPDPEGGERFTLLAQGNADYRLGVLFTVAAPADRAYVFRFADKNWNPPVRGGLVPGKTEGISYARWGASGSAPGGAVDVTEAQPVISAAPVAMRSLAGASAFFSVQESGGSLAYRWHTRRGGFDSQRP
jgi:hypothetical protein